MKILNDSYMHDTIRLNIIVGHCIPRLNNVNLALVYRDIDNHVDSIDGFHAHYIGRTHPKHIALDSEVLI